MGTPLWKYLSSQSYLARARIETSSVPSNVQMSRQYFRGSARGCALAGYPAGTTTPTGLKKGHEMRKSHTAVTAEVGLRLVLPDSPSLPVLATLRYDASDPYAISISFHTGADGSAVDWSFARQLLTDGVTHPVGEGDVRVWPTTREDRQLIALSLTSPSGSALFETALSDVVEFLTRSYSTVPTGSESDFVDLDSELALLLWNDRA